MDLTKDAICMDIKFLWIIYKWGHNQDSWAIFSS